MARRQPAANTPSPQQPNRKSGSKPGPAAPERKGGENMQRNKHDRDRQGEANDVDPENSPATCEKCRLVRRSRSDELPHDERMNRSDRPHRVRSSAVR